MRIIGLTGGIASGKSTVRKMLEELGAKVVDADAVYHCLIAPAQGSPSPLARAIENQFPGVLQEDGQINRQALGQVVFNNADKRRQLEAITHPAVAQAVASTMAKLAQDGNELAIYDVPLLYERQLQQAMHGVVVVWVPQDIQLQRLQQRDRLSPQQAQQRLASQLSLDEKRRAADWVIDNSGSVDETRRQVQTLWETLRPEG